MEEEEAGDAGNRGKVQLAAKRAAQNWNSKNCGRRDQNIRSRVAGESRGSAFQRTKYSLVLSTADEHLVLASTERW